MLIDDWRSAHKLWSVRLSGAMAVTAGLDWLVPSLSDAIPKWAYLTLAAAVVVARLLVQKRGSDGKPE